jgi:hypothetical protein
MVYKSLNLCDNTNGHPGWMQLVQIFVKLMTLQMVPCNDNFFSRHAASFYWPSCHAMIFPPWTIKPIAFLPSFVSRQTTNQPVLFGTRATSFRWKLCPFWSHAALTFSLLYFCLETCHRMIQYSSPLLIQRQ